MKKMIKNLMLVAVAAMAFVGCQNDNDEMNATTRKVVLEFVAGFDEDTRATFGDKDGDTNTYPTYWEGNEWVSVTISDGENEFRSNGSVVLPEGEETSRNAKIRAEFNLEPGQELPEAGTITATVGSFDYYTGEVSISTYQSPTEKSVASMSLIAETSYYDGDITGAVLQFAHAAAYGKMTLSQFADDAADITKVKVTINENETIEITPNNSDTKLTTPTIWFTTYGGDIETPIEVETMTIEATVDGVVYAKTIDMTDPEIDNPLKFTTGRVSAFEVKNIAEKPADYTLTMTKITSIEGNVVTFANDSGEDLTIEFNPGLTSISAGHYTGVNPDWFQGGIYPWTSETALEYKGDSILTHIAGVDGHKYANDKNGLDISVENVDGTDIYTINAKFGIYIDGDKEIDFTFVGAWEAVKSTNCVVKGANNNSTMFELWFADSQSDMDNDEYVYLYLRVPTSVYKVLPEGTYTYEDAVEGDFIINNWSIVKYNSSNYDIKSATLTVSHTETGYIFDATITDNNDKEFNYYYEGAVDSKNTWDLINNPPIPYKDITVEAEMVTVTASYDEGYLNYYGDSFDIDITTAEVDGVAYNLSLALAIPIGESSNGLIPAKTYTLDAADYTLTSESTGDSEKFANAQLVVGQTATGYTLAFTGENVMKTKFNLTYEGKIEKATEYNGFRNPGDATKLATPQNVNYSLDGTTATITWGAVDNADHYEVSVNGAEAVSVNVTTYSFDTEYETNYSVSVVAVPAVDNTLYKNSDAGDVEFTTPKDPNATTPVFTSAEYVVSGSDLVVTFTDGANTLKLTYFANGATSFAPGTYTLHFNFSGGYSLFNGGTMQSCTVTVTGDPGPEQVFTFELNDYIKDYEFKYVGELSEGMPEFGYGYMAQEWTESNGYLIISLADPTWEYYEFAFITNGNYLEEKIYYIGTDIVREKTKNTYNSELLNEGGTVTVTYDASTQLYTLVVKATTASRTLNHKFVEQFTGQLGLSAPM